MLLRSTRNEMDNDERMQDWKRWLLRSGLIIVALLVIGAVMSHSSWRSERNPVLHSFVVEPDTRPLVLGDIRKGDPVSKDTYEEKFSMVVGVFFKRGESPNRCTGVLVSKKKVLTAGHCCDPAHTTGHSVIHDIELKGQADELYIADGGRAIELYRYGDDPVHEFAYDPDKSETETPLYDLCMITLLHGVADDPLIKLPASGADPPQGNVGFTMIGYGRTGNGDGDELNPDMELFSAAAKIVDCPDKLALGGNPPSADYDTDRWGIVKELVFCAKGTKWHSHACRGDSGGPLLGEPMADEGNKRMVYGILSDGKKPCENGPNSYSDLAKAEFAAWVREKVPDYSDD